MSERVKTWIKVKKVVKNADVVLEVVDSRDPLSTRSKKLEALVMALGKPLIIVINKADLVPREILEEWKNLLEREYPTIYISARERLGTTFLWKAIKRVVPRTKDVVVVAVTGFPNVGKSTIINILKGKHTAGTSPIPGYTRDPMRVRVSKWLRVIDTPGVIPLEGDEDELVLRFALSPEKLEDPIPATLKLIKKALSIDPNVFEKTYGVKSREPYKLLEELAERRKLYLKGGKLNVEEAARIILRDWQNGTLVFYVKPPKRNNL